MSLISSEYGPELYTGPDGTIDYRFRAASEPAESSNPNSSLFHLVKGSDTGGAYGLFKVEFAATEGAGTGTHFHRTFHEDILVLSGSMALFDGERWRDAGPGDFLHIPPGGLHSFSNKSGEAASMLMLFAPGGPREDYFANLRNLGEMDEKQRREFFLKHDNWFVDGGPNM